MKWSRKFYVFGKVESKDGLENLVYECKENDNKQLKPLKDR